MLLNLHSAAFVELWIVASQVPTKKKINTKKKKEEQEYAEFVVFGKIRREL